MLRLLGVRTMSSQLGPIDITCDAPPYPVVQACARLGFQSPLDVRWSRLSHYLNEEEGSSLGIHSLKWFFTKRSPKDKTCCCGGSLPLLEWYTFTFLSGGVADYHLGQCPRCRTIFWEQG